MRRKTGCARPAIVIAAALAIACGASPARTRPARARPLGPLITLVPADSTLVIVARPAELVAAAPTARIIRAVFPADQLDRFSQRTGIDPRELEELVVADHPDGRVVLARGPFDAPFAVREAGERMAPLEASVDTPRIRRVGILGARRVDATALAPRTVLWVEGAPQLAARVLAAARRHPASRNHALSSAIASPLRDSLGDAPFALYSLAPLGLPRDTGVGLLLARERALAASVRPAGDRALEVAVELHGEFPNGAEANFRALAHAVAESDLGGALGMRDALPTLRIEADTHRVRLDAEVDAAVLSIGLRTLLVAEMRELLGEENAAPSARDASIGALEDADRSAGQNLGSPR